MFNKPTTREKGNKAEDIACEYLQNKGFLIQERNHLRKWGEIDIVCIKDEILHFVEVKSITIRGKNEGYRAEENVSELKVRKLRRVIQTYLNEKKYGTDASFLFHVVAITFNATGEYSIKMLDNIIL